MTDEIYIRASIASIPVGIIVLIKVSKKNLESKNLNETLDLILRKAQHSFDQLKFSEIIFTIDDIVNKIKGKNEKPTLLVAYVNQMVSLHDASTTKDI